MFCLSCICRSTLPEVNYWILVPVKWLMLLSDTLIGFVIYPLTPKANDWQWSSVHGITITTTTHCIRQRCFGSTVLVVFVWHAPSALDAHVLPAPFAVWHPASLSHWDHRTDQPPCPPATQIHSRDDGQPLIQPNTQPHIRPTDVSAHQ